MLKVTPEQATTALNEFINLGEELKPMVTETDLVERFLLTLHQYHRAEPVNISIWLNGLKSDGESVKATAFQSVKIVDNNHNTVGYVLLCWLTLQVLYRLKSLPCYTTCFIKQIT